MTQSELMEYEELCAFIISRYTDSGGTVDGAIRELVRRSMLLSIENERLRTTRPEPSRLEIAAMMLQGLLADPDGQFVDYNHVAKEALAQADALLAAAKGGE